VLTHGGLLDTNVLDNLDVMKQTVDWADGRIEVLPGAGVNIDTKEQITSYIGVQQAHGTHVLGELKA
jgi:copper homeostasis protein